MKNFKSFSLKDSLLKSLEKLKLETPTEVQIKAIPFALKGKDVIVSAPTGTGKTLAFAIPLIEKLLEDKENCGIVITPTRELATQISAVFQSLLSYNHEVKAALLIGGMPMHKQLAQLRLHPQLIVGTPGRINDHLNRKSLKLGNTKFVVLDEMDRMLDMGFSIQIDEIFKFTPDEKQILMLSATIPPAIVKISKKYLNEPVQIQIDSENMINSDITQDFLHISRNEKYDLLLKQLSTMDGSKIIFVKTRRNTEELAKRLNADSFQAKAIHGDLRQNQREKIIRLFRKEQYNIVVATDVASRGIDVPHIKNVINYNLPTNPEDYVHRIGRTGRAGQKGNAISFVCQSESKEWRALEFFLDPTKPRPRGGSSSGGRSRSGGGRNSRSGGGSERPRRSFSSDSSRSGGGSERPRRNFGSDSSRSGGGSERPRRNFGSDSSRSSDSSERPRRNFGSDSSRSSDSSERPRRNFGSDSSRSSGSSERPRRNFGSDSSRSSGSSERPRSNFASDSSRSSGSSERPRSNFGSDSSRSSGGSERPRRNFGSDSSRSSGGSERPRSNFGSDSSRSSGSSERPRRNFGSDSSRSSGSSERPKRNFGSDSSRSSGSSERPKRNFGSDSSRSSGSSERPKRNFASSNGKKRFDRTG